jgi:hypothetical protein
MADKMKLILRTWWLMLSSAWCVSLGDGEVLSKKRLLPAAGCPTRKAAAGCAQSMNLVLKGGLSCRPVEVYRSICHLVMGDVALRYACA